MSVRVQIGDLFDSSAQTLVNTVNCVGVMGKGIALEFKRRFPDMYADYVVRCHERKVKLGEPYLYREHGGRWILNFPTKDHWRNVARLEDIVRGLETLYAHYREWGITSMAVPPLGCGQGQLEWRVVGPTLTTCLSALDIPVDLYAPFRTPAEQLTVQFLLHPTSVVPQSNDRIRPAWVALAEVVGRLETDWYHHPTGRVIFQKIAYVATEEGLPTGLDFVKGSYGPYSSGLKSVIAKLVNNGLLREERLGNMICVRTGRTFADARKEFRDTLSTWEETIKRTSSLFRRLDTSRAEIAATVIYAARHLVPSTTTPTEFDVLEAVKSWKSNRSPALDEREVGSAIRNLAALGWIDVRGSNELPLSESELLLT